MTLREIIKSYEISEETRDWLLESFSPSYFYLPSNVWIVLAQMKIVREVVLNLPGGPREGEFRIDRDLYRYVDLEVPLELSDPKTLLHSLTRVYIEPEPNYYYHVGSRFPCVSKFQDDIHIFGSYVHLSLDDLIEVQDLSGMVEVRYSKGRPDLDKYFRNCQIEYINDPDVPSKDIVISLFLTRKGMTVKDYVSLSSLDKIRYSLDTYFYTDLPKEEVDRKMIGVRFSHELVSSYPCEKSDLNLPFRLSDTKIYEFIGKNVFGPSTCETDYTYPYTILRDISCGLELYPGYYIYSGHLYDGGSDSTYRVYDYYIFSQFRKNRLDYYFEDCFKGSSGEIEVRYKVISEETKKEIEELFSGFRIEYIQSQEFPEGDFSITIYEPDMTEILV